MRAIREEKERVSDGVYIVKDGKTKKATPPATGFGKQVVTWENGKPTRCEVSFTERV